MVKLRTTTRLPRQLLIAAIVSFLAFSLATDKSNGQSGENDKPIAVYLVRHAEKQEPGSSTDTDTPLSKEGQARAEKLASLLSGCSISAAYTTPYKRTTETAKTVLEKNQITGSPIAINPRGMAALLEQIRRSSGKSLLVVGHSNTIPAVARALAGRNDAVPDIPETSYDNLFVVTITRWEPREAVVKLFRYGATSAAAPSTLPEFTGCAK